VPVVTGVQPTHPVGAPTLVSVSVQQRRDDVPGDLGWEDAPSTLAVVTDQTAATTTSDLIRWSGVVDFAQPAKPGRFRLLIREHEYLSSNYVVTASPLAAATRARANPGRLIYAETMALDDALVGGPPAPTGTTLEE